MTIADLVKQRAERTPDAVAMREKHRGLWREITWRDYWRTSETVARALKSLGVQPGDRLVQQQQLRLHRQGAAELDAFLHAVRQQPHRQAPPLGQLEEVHDVLDHGPVGDLLAPGAAEPRDGGEGAVADVVVPAEHEVLQHGQVLEQLDVLEGPGHAELGDLVRAQTGEVVPVERHPALLRPVHTGDHIEDRRLPGPIGPDDGEQLVLGDGERNTVDGFDAGEAEPDVFETQHGDS
jgi:hypothetical protein